MNIKNIKYKKNAAVFIFAVLFAIFVLMFTFHVSAKNNIALECKIDSSCGGTAEMLVDRDENYSTKWHAADGANHSGEPHWIILDFETEKTFDSIRLVKASQGTEDFGRDELNASGFRFEISSDKTNWVKIFEVTDGGGNDICDGYFFPATARYLKLIVTNPEQDEYSNENQAVRLYDLKVFEYIPPIEEESVEENSDIEETTALSTVITVPPKTSDSLLFILVILLLTVISAGIISRIFSSRRTR